MQARRSIAACAALAALTAAATAPARAVTCADRLVQARGEPARFEVLAKAKARGNWRAQVRAMPAFGPQYSNWSKALDADYRCTNAEGGYSCTAVARPCRE
jgi:hypothetical protein